VPRRPGALGLRRGLGALPSQHLLLAAVLALCAVGLVMVLSASSVLAYARYHDSYAFFKKQLLWVALGLVAMLAVSRIDYRRWRRLGAPLLVASVLGLLAVLAHPAAVTAYGATRWIPVGFGITLQPAEFAKLALLLFSADVLTRKRRLFRDVRHLLVPVLPVTLLLAALVMAEPDLGTTMLLCAIAAGMLFIAGVPLPLFSAMSVAGLAGGLGLIMLAPYRRSRFFSFVNPAADAQDGGWQFIQGSRALGSGGLFGVGLGASKQKWFYVPNAHTDFIFAVIGEELGLLGTLAIIGLFLLIAYAGIRVARRAPDQFGRYLAGGITLWLVVQAVVNIGAVVGVLPITGVPLPLVSFGGSSMLVLLTAIGILLNVARQEVAVEARAPLRATVAATVRAARRRAAPATVTASAMPGLGTTTQRTPRSAPRANATTKATTKTNATTPTRRSRPQTQRTGRPADRRPRESDR
jgi:cell division protein FtsW